MFEPHNANANAARCARTRHSAAAVVRLKCSAARSINRSATSSFDICGQLSTSLAVKRCTVLLSPPKTRAFEDTSLATIQSAPLAFSFFFA